MIIKSELIKFMGANIFNLHHGNLPKYRGMGPITNAILNGEKYFGISLHLVEEKIDSGEILEQINFKIAGLHNEEVYQKCLTYDHKLLTLFFLKINLSRELKTFKQDQKNASYFSKKSLNYLKPFIDFKQSSDGVIKFCKAYYFPSRNLFPLINFGENTYYSKLLPKLGAKASNPNIFKFNKQKNTLSISSNDKWIIFKEIITK